MQLSDLTSKKPKELNVMCAELCGWKLSERKTFQGNPIYERDGVFAATVCAPRDDVRWLPNYTDSWDAIMPEVRKASAEQSMAFIEHLRAVLDIKATGEYAYTWMVLTATAQQLTIALILTLTSQH